MKKRKLNFSQKFIIIFLVVLIIAGAGAGFGIYKYYHVDEVNNRLAGQNYDVASIGVSFDHLENIFAEGFDPIMPNSAKFNNRSKFTSNGDSLVVLHNPEKDVNSTSTFEAYAITLLTDSPFVDPQNYGLTDQDVVGYKNKAFWISDDSLRKMCPNLQDYMEQEHGVIITEEEIDSFTPILLGYTISSNGLFSLDNQPADLVDGVRFFSFVSYSAYSNKIAWNKKEHGYPVSKPLSTKDSAKTTTLKDVKVGSVTIDLSICEYLSEDEKVKNEIALIANGESEISKLLGSELLVPLQDYMGQAQDVLYTMVTGKFKIDGINYEINYQLMPRFYDANVGYGGKDSADFEKLNDVATKSMTYLATEFLNNK